MARKYYIEDGVAIPAIKFENSQPAGFTEVTDADQLLDLTQKTYKQRERDGRNYYNQFRSGIYLDIVNGSITDQQAFDLESHMKEVSANLQNGNWVTAQSLCSALSLSGIFDQPLKDSLLSDFSDYIAANY